MHNQKAGLKSVEKNNLVDIAEKDSKVMPEIRVRARNPG
jgi:hypothetical protein